jgi:hypothetical protein
VVLALAEADFFIVGCSPSPRFLKDIHQLVLRWWFAPAQQLGEVWNSRAEWMAPPKIRADDTTVSGRPSTYLNR